MRRRIHFHQPEIIVKGGEEEEIGARVEGGHLHIRHEAAEFADIRQPRLFRVFGVIGEVHAVPREEKAEFQPPLAADLQRVQNKIDALQFHDPPDEQEDQLVFSHVVSFFKLPL